MTVCVAAICDNNTHIIGASDRMLTAGDIEFQPPQTKIWGLTNSIVAMVAGDMTIQSEIYQKVFNIVIDRIKIDPSNWWKVKDMAELYSNCYSELRFKRAEKEILWPLGLDKDKFIKQQKEMDTTLVQKIAKLLSNFEIPGTETIIAGNDEYIDKIMPHLYVIHNERVSCNDATGFACIGLGYWHANSQFMSSGHTRFSSGPRTLQITYQAKKKAEVAPGVGKETDMFIIGPELGSFRPIKEEVVFDLDKIYNNYLKKIKDVDKKTEKRLEEYLKKKHTPKGQPQ